MNRFTRRPLGRPILAAAAVVSAVALVAGCAGGGSGSDAAAQLTGPPVKIFSINDDTADHPEPEVIAAGTKAVEYVNANGGINGRPLEIEFCNGQLDPNAAAACANRALADPAVVAATGNFMVQGSGAVKAFSDAGMAQLAPYPVAQAEYSCATCVNTNGGNIVSSLGAATALADVEGAKRLAFVGVDAPAARALPDLLNQVLQSSGRPATIVSSQFAPYGSADFNGIVAGLQSAGVDGVVLAIPLNLQLSFLRAASSLGLTIPLGTNMSANIVEELQGVGPAGENVRFSTFFRHDLPGYQLFRDQMADVDLDGVYFDTDISANMWDSVMLFAQLARATPDPTRQSILDAAKKTTAYDGGMMARPVDFTKTFDGLGGNYKGISNTFVYYTHVENGEVVHDLDGRAVDVFAPPSAS